MRIHVQRTPAGVTRAQLPRSGSGTSPAVCATSERLEAARRRPPAPRRHRHAPACRPAPLSPCKMRPAPIAIGLVPACPPHIPAAPSPTPRIRPPPRRSPAARRRHARPRSAPSPRPSDVGAGSTPDRPGDSPATAALKRARPPHAAFANADRMSAFDNPPLHPRP